MSDIVLPILSLAFLGVNTIGLGFLVLYPVKKVIDLFVIIMALIATAVILYIVIMIIPSAVREHFELPRKPEKGGEITIGVLPNTPGPMKGVMKDLNVVGNQIEADSEYDTVDTKILTKK
jgi:hypothetical protein